MDTLTHIEFAQSLLHSARASDWHAIACLFPQIDREPPTLHRLHAHALRKAPWLTRMGLNALAGATDEAVATCRYEWERFHIEKPRLLTYAERFALTRTEEIDSLAGQVAFVSHLYLDTFNQPVQAFTPFTAAGSGQYALWERLGDFRKELYVGPAITDLRAEFRQRTPVARHSASPALWLRAMTWRLRDLSLTPIDPRLVEEIARACAWPQVDASACVETVHVLIDTETLLTELHEKYLVSRAESLEPAPAQPIELEASPSAMLH
jgi:hypothetical protein